MTAVSLKVELKIGPATVAYETPEDAELFHTSQADFMQKVMDLMNYVGSPDDPPPAPVPAVAAAPTPQSHGGASPFLQTYRGATDELYHAKGTDVQAEADPVLAEFLEEEPDGPPTGATVVGRVAPMQEVKAS